MKIVKNENDAVYTVDRHPTSDDDVIAHALAILTGRMKQPGQTFACPGDVETYCQLKIGGLPHEVFVVLFLDVHNRVLAVEEMFRGTLTQTSVYPREVLIRALHHNAAAVVLAHNHPSGSVQPSRADETLTQALRSALALVDVRILDHVIVAPGLSLSMAERGLV